MAKKEIQAVVNEMLEDVNFEKNKIDVIDVKGGVSATINLTQRCTDTIKDYVDNHRGEPKKGHEKALFLNDGKRLSKTKLHEIHKEYKYRAGLPNDFKFPPHLWRTTGITHYAQSEKDIKLLMAQSRHQKF